MSRPKLNLEQVHALLNKLENDDAFRTLFQDDVAAGLAQIGAPVEAAMCIHVSKLASKEAIRQARQAITAQLNGVLEQAIHHLDASHTSAPTRVLLPQFARLATA